MIKAYMSSSKGNVFEANDGVTRLLLECGVTHKRLQQLLNHELSAFSGCLITHEHMDHARAANQLYARGLDLYASPGTFDMLAMESGANVHPLEPEQQVRIGSFLVLPFPVHHDAAQPYGYLLYSIVTQEKAVFVTDTYRVAHTFAGLTEIAIECNYSDALLKDSKLDPTLIKRITRNHMSLEGCKAFLSACDMSQVRRIHLVHLSDDRADAEGFRREIAAMTGREVVVA